MRASRLALPLAILGTLLCVSCSSSGSGHVTSSTPTVTAGSTAGSDAAVGVSGASGSVVGFTGAGDSCPAEYPERIANAGVDDLSGTLVPLDTTSVRVCMYKRSAANAPPRLTASGSRSAIGEQRLRNELNGLGAVGGPTDDSTLPSCASPNASSFLLTFSGGSRRVVVWDHNGCPYLTNNGIVTTFTPGLRSEFESSVIPI